LDVPNPVPDFLNLTWNEQVAAQTWNLTDAFGQTAAYTLQELDQFYQAIGNGLIVYGFGMGMCAVMFIAMIALSKPEKRRTVIFGLNLSALLFQFIRCLTDAINFTSVANSLEIDFLSTWAFMTGAAWGTLYLFFAFSVLWYAVILTSLVLQVRVVFAAEPTSQKLVTVGLSLTAFVTFAFNLTNQSMDLNYLIHYGSGLSSNMVRTVAEAMFVTDVGLTSLIFVVKLFYLIHRRRRMGFTRFGPLQVIMIMGVQCLLAPCTNHISAAANW
jgi:pheromone alpha factor receptor